MKAEYAVLTVAIILAAIDIWYLLTLIADIPILNIITIVIFDEIVFIFFCICTGVLFAAAALLSTRPHPTKRKPKKSKKCKHTAMLLIEMVETYLRNAHPEIETLASTWIPDGATEPPNTLLFGETYYTLEDAITLLLQDTFYFG